MKKLLHAKKILKIAIPSGLSSFLDILNISVALLFVGKLSTDHIVAFGAGMNFLMLFYTITAIFFTGTNALIARLYSTKSTKIPNVLSTLALGSFLTSLPLLLLALQGIEFYLTWLGLLPKAFELSNIYLQILVYALPALLLKTTLTSAFSAISLANIPFYVKCFCTLFNIIANYVLIFGAGFITPLGIYGAGLANLCATYLEALFLLGFAYKFFGFKLVLDWEVFKTALKIGLPTGFERTFTLFSLVLISKFLLYYGNEVLAGFQIGSRIEAFAFMPGFGFMVASMSLVGQNIHHLKLAKYYTYLTLGIASLFMGILGIVMCLWGQDFAMFFTQDENVAIYAWHYLLAVGLSQVPLIFIFVLDGALRGAGATKISLYINASSIWGLRILPMSLCTSFGLSYEWIFFIIFLETYLRGGIFWFVFQKQKWKPIELKGLKH